LADIPQLIAETLQAKPGFIEPYCNNRGDVMHSALYAADEGYINEVVDSEVTPCVNSLGVEDDGIRFGGDLVEESVAENARAASDLINENGSASKDLITQYRKYMRNRMDESAYANAVKDTLSCLRLLPYLLRTVSFVFNADNAQVVPMVLHRNPDIDAVTDMVHLQRLMWFVTVSTYKDAFGGEGAIYFLIKPHKMHGVQKHDVKDCRTPREALVVCSADDSASKINSLSYSFLGGGVPFEPPHGHGLVSRGVPLPLAERYLAVVLFFSNGSVMKECFCSRSAANTGSDKELKELEINQSAANVTFHLQQLRWRFGTIANLLKAFDMKPPEAIDDQLS
jgi:hypothetical protein